MLRSIIVRTKLFIREILHPETKNNVQAKRVKPWFLINGDNTLRLRYTLDTSSVVLDLGGYKGDWAAQIWNLYKPSLYIFEPYKPYCDSIKNRFNGNDKIKVFEFGLGAKKEELAFSVAENASSVFNAGEKTEFIQIESISQFIRENEIKNIDLIKINIEGGEFELLEYLLDAGLITLFDNIQVQFHDFVPDAEKRMKAIQHKLALTHYPTYQYEFVWENWKRKQDGR